MAMQPAMDRLIRTTTEGLKPRQKYNAARGGRAPKNYLRWFADFVRTGEANPEMRAEGHDADWLAGQLWNCSDVMPSELCTALGLPEGSSYGRGARSEFRDRPRASGRFTTEYEGVTYTHRLLWQITEQQAALALARKREYVNFSLVAVTFAFFTLEAYVNFAGLQLEPARWKDEQNGFRKEPYRGWNGKLRRIIELTNVPWQPDVRPLKTVMELRDLRDSIGHGKAEPFSGSYFHDAEYDRVPWTPDSTIRSMVLPKSRLNEILGDVRSILDQMHPAVAAVVDEPFFKTGAVGGPAWFMSASTSLTRA